MNLAAESSSRDDPVDITLILKRPVVVTLQRYRII